MDDSVKEVPESAYNIWQQEPDTHVIDFLKRKARRLHDDRVLPTSKAQWDGDKVALRSQLWKKFGVSYDNSLALDMRILSTVDCDGYRIDNLIYQSRPDFYVTASLYVPSGEGVFPAVINTHGHYMQGRFADRVQSRGHILAQNGFVSLSVDAYGSGERAETQCDYSYHGAHAGMSLFDVGQSLLGIQVVDNMRGVDLLQSLSFVNADAIGSTGASGGGNQSMWLTAMDERIKAGVPVVSVGSFEMSVASCNCVCETLPGVLDIAEQSHILGLIAPRPLLICNNLQDLRWFHPTEMLRSFNGGKKIYELLGGGDNLAYEIFDRPHGYYPEVRESMLGWMTKHLKGEGDGKAITEPTINLLEETDMYCFEKGKRPDLLPSLTSYCRGISANAIAAIDSQEKISRKEKQQELLNLLKLTSSDVEIGDYQIMIQATRTLEGYDWSYSSLHLPNEEMISLAYCENKGQNNQLRVLLAFEGKEEAIKSAEAQNYLAAGDAILLVDLFGIGESHWGIFPNGHHHEMMRSYLFLGEVLPAQWAVQLNHVLDYIAKSYAESEMSLVCFREAILLPLILGALGVKMPKLVGVNSPLEMAINDKMAEKTVSMAYHIPGIIPWGDMAMLRALANLDIEFLGAKRLCGKVLTEIEVENTAKRINQISLKFC